MAIEVSALISAVSITLAVVTFIIARHKDTKEATQEEDSKMDAIKESLLKANMKLDQVCATTNETRTDIKSMQNTMQEHDKRITILERDLNTAWTKIDEMKEQK